jgi:hypothetical protein
MCKAKDYSEQLLEIYNNINNDFQSLYNELSQADLIQQDLLHMIEKGGFNASEGYKMAKMIYDNRVNRRKIKNELKPLQHLKSNFTDVNFQALNKVHQTVLREDTTLTRLTENQIYTPRVLGKASTPVVKPTVAVNKPTVVVNNAPKIEANNQTKTYYTKTGEEVQVIQKISDKLYYVKMKGNRECLLRGTRIVNLDKVKFG